LLWAAYGVLIGHPEVYAQGLIMVPAAALVVWSTRASPPSRVANAA
jgi:hypothetical protein